jgi:ABC-type branched-subunit amino acid transport system substrate-binding protein
MVPRSPAGDTAARVYVSLPLTGPPAVHGRDVLRGIELAHQAAGEPVGLIVADTGGRNRRRRAVGHAEAAAGDDRAVGYLGDFHSTQVAATAPLLGRASVLQVAPTATDPRLGSPTLVCLMPDDRQVAGTIADWLVTGSVERLLVVHDYGDGGYAAPLAGLCVDRARERGVSALARRVWDDDESPADDLDGVQALLYVGVAGSGAERMWADLHAADPKMWLLGTEGIAEPWLAAAIDPSAAERTRFFVPPHTSFALYGFEAMRLVLDAIDAVDAVGAGGGRAEIAAAGRAPGGRSGVIGRYTIGPDGRATGVGFGRQAVVAGRLVWDGRVT